MPRQRRVPPDLWKAAEGRVAGQSWSSIAAQLGLTTCTVSHWPGRYPLEWQAALTTARQRQAFEVAGEAVHTLRVQLRSTDDDVSRAAAVSLLKHGLTTPDDDARAKISDDLLAYVTRLEGMTDVDFHDHVQKIVRDFSTVRDAPGVSPAAGPDGPEPVPGTGVHGLDG